MAKKRKIAGALGGALLLVLLAACTKHAAPNPFVLTDELLVASASSAGQASGCTNGKDGRFTFAVSGRASGTYAGTFTAQGEVLLADSRVIELHETFAVTSGTSTVSGRVTSIVGASNAMCISDYGIASVTYRYEATLHRAGTAATTVGGVGFLTVSGGSPEAGRVVQDFKGP